MQIRLANRQDEPAIRNIVSEANQAFGQSELDLTGADADLVNLDAQYHWNDGIAIVAEIDGTIVGFAGARRTNKPETLVLERLAVSDTSAPYVQSLLDTIGFFAVNYDYTSIHAPTNRVGTIDAHAFAKAEFTQQASEWTRKIPPRPNGGQQWGLARKSQ